MVVGSSFCWFSMFFILQLKPSLFHFALSVSLILQAMARSLEAPLKKVQIIPGLFACGLQAFISKRFVKIPLYGYYTSV